MVISSRSGAGIASLGTWGSVGQCSRSLNARSSSWLVGWPTPGCGPRPAGRLEGGVLGDLQQDGGRDGEGRDLEAAGQGRRPAEAAPWRS